MSSEPDERLLKLAEMLADGGAVDWAELQNKDPDLAHALARFRELQALSAAHRAAAPGAGPALAESPTEPWSREPLFTWGTIQVLEQIGEGGFAVVYRAWDPALEREVALKLSRPDAPPTATGIQRWLDEARRLAKVRHPNVLMIHGVDVREGRAGFWTDLIHGRTLEQMIESQGSLGGAEAALIGLELCRALAAVHGAGLVHGDLKASNVMREGSSDRSSHGVAGRIVLMDFGASGESSPPISRSASFFTPLTAAPEVMRGEPPSRQSDLYSLGVLLYRLLTHRHPIESADAAELESKVQHGLRDSLRDQRPDLGASLVAVVERALDPDLARRFASAGEMERALSAALSEERHSEPDPLRQGGGTRRRPWRAALGITSLLALAVAAVAVVWWLRSGTGRPPPERIHFNVGAPRHKLLRLDPNQFAISPDGSMLAFIAFDSTGQSLWVRHLGNNEPRELKDTGDAKFPFWSPDSRQVGFFSQGKMRRIRLDGSEPEVICAAPNPRGASWGSKGVIVFSSAHSALFQVPATGGTPTPVTAIDTVGGPSGHAWPGFLPDGEHFTYVARRIEPYEIDDPPAPGPWTSYVGSIRSKRSVPLLQANSVAMFAPPHHVIYIRDHNIYAQDFDVRALRLKGEPIRIGDSPAPVSILGSKCGSVSTNGVLAWQSAGGLKQRLVWIDRHGRRIRDLSVPSDRWFHISVSPDGRRAVVRRNDESGGSLWLLDLERETMSLLSSAATTQDPGAWSPDGKEILYSRRGPGGVCEVHRMTVNQPETDRVFYRSDGFLQNAFGWSPDGQSILIQDMHEKSGFDVMLAPAQGGEPRPWLATPFAERRPQISPDGKWVLYLTNESGVWQACVRPFSSPRDHKQLVSSVPVFYAHWSDGGREILLLARDFRIRSVKVVSGGQLTLSPPEELFTLPNDVRGLAPLPSGQRFLMVEPERRTANEPSIEVNLNWMAGLRN